MITLLFHLLRLLPFLFGGHPQLALDGRPTEPPGLGTIIPIPEVGGLHHRYVRRTA